MDNKDKRVKQYREAWRQEMIAARNYAGLAEREANAERRAILERMAQVEEGHAVKWAARLRELGAEPGDFVESAGERARRWLLLQTGTESAVTNLENAENDADGLYDVMLADAQSDAERADLIETQRDERAHARVLNEMVQPKKPGAQRRLDQLLNAEKWHVHGAGWIGQAIYGVNDGLGAAFGVVSGVAGATSVNAEFVLLSGLATALASALSMGSGAYLATKSEREVYEAEVERERKEIEQDPEEEREEMELFYQLKGFKSEEAKLLAGRLAEKPEQLLKTLAHEELGLSESTFPNPWRAAISATISTALGAIIPVLPFFFLSGITALTWSFVVSTLAHFVVGASKVVVTGRPWIRSGLEMTFVGLGEAVITYVIGLLIAPVLK